MKPALNWVLSIALAGAAGWFVAPADSVNAELVQVRRDRWELPSLPRRPDLLAQGLAMVTSPIFEPEAQIVAAATAAAAPPEDQRWRVAGLFRRDGVRSVMISFMAPGKPAQALRVGDKLPSGHVVTRIDDNEICVQLGKKSYRLGVEYRVE